MSNGQKLDPADRYVGEMDSLLKSAETRDKDLNIHQRIWLVMQDVWYVQKRDSGNNKFYNTVEHDDVTRKVRPALIRHGVIAYPHEIYESDAEIIRKEKYNANTNSNYEEIEFFTQVKIIYKFANIDDPEDFILVPTYAHGVDKAGNATGKAISYAIKYALLKALSLETGDKEDTDHLINSDADENAIEVYNMLGKDLFGDKWYEMSRKKIFHVTGGKTAEAVRAPTWAINEAIKNLYKLKKEKNENPDKDIEEINKEEEKKNSANDIISDFKD